MKTKIIGVFCYISAICLSLGMCKTLIDNSEAVYSEVRSSLLQDEMSEDFINCVVDALRGEKKARKIRTMRNHVDSYERMTKPKAELDSAMGHCRNKLQQNPTVEFVTHGTDQLQFAVAIQLTIMVLFMLIGLCVLCSCLYTKIIMDQMIMNV